MSALPKSQLQRIQKKLEQTAVAVAMMGTRRPKLMEMARLAEPVQEMLDAAGMRPDVKKVRDGLTRAVHNVKHGRTVAKEAAGNLRALAAAVQATARLVDRGLVPVPEEFQAGIFRLVNVWGYTAREVQPFEEFMRKVGGRLAAAGVDFLVPDSIRLSPGEEDSDETVLTFVPGSSDMVSKVDAVLDRKGVYRAFGQKLWAEFEAKDHEVWGGRAGTDRFLNAFVGAMIGKRLDPDTEARLAVSAGRFSGGKWSMRGVEG